MAAQWTPDEESPVTQTRLLTVSPLWPGCPGSPSFPAGPLGVRSERQSVSMTAVCSESYVQDAGLDSRGGPLVRGNLLVLEALADPGTKNPVNPL